MKPNSERDLRGICVYPVLENGCNKTISKTKINPRALRICRKMRDIYLYVVSEIQSNFMTIP